MTTVRHVARAVGTTGASTPAYRVDIRSGRHEVIADEPTVKGWELATIDVDVRYDVDDDGHSSIKRTITVPPDLPAEQRRRLAEVAEGTPVTLAIRNVRPSTQPSSPATPDVSERALC